MKGKLVSIEGIDGCGKTAHTKLLAEWLRANGYRVAVTDEPTNGIIGGNTRSMPDLKLIKL